MKLDLISYSKKNDNNDSLEDSVAFCARVSNPSNQNNKTTNSKLIHYLIANQHWSQLEMVSICLEIDNELLQLRSGNNTQKDHREIAIGCAKAIEPIFPMISEFLSQ